VVGNENRRVSASEIRARLEAIQADEDRLAGQLAHLKDARRRLASERRVLQTTLEWMRMGSNSADAPLAATTIGEAAAEILARSGPMRVADLTRKLQDVGKLPLSASAYPTLYKTLARDNRFKKSPGNRGYWKLA